MQCTKREIIVNWKNKIWRYATILVVALIILNPEMAQFALFIDIVGLDVFLLLLEAQVLVVLGGIIGMRGRHIYSYLMHLCGRYLLLFSWQGIGKKAENVSLVIPGQAAFMHLLVFSAALGIALDMCQ